MLYAVCCVLRVLCVVCGVLYDVCYALCVFVCLCVVSLGVCGVCCVSLHFIFCVHKYGTVRCVKRVHSLWVFVKSEHGCSFALAWPNGYGAALLRRVLNDLHTCTCTFSCAFDWLVKGVGLPLSL